MCVCECVYLYYSGSSSSSSSDKEAIKSFAGINVICKLIQHVQNISGPLFPTIELTDEVNPPRRHYFSTSSFIKSLWVTKEEM